VIIVASGPIEFPFVARHRYRITGLLLNKSDSVEVALWDETKSMAAREEVGKWVLKGSAMLGP
jgi:hypothetical protein